MTPSEVPNGSGTRSALRALQADPLIEELYRRTALCHLRLGRPAEAVSALERCEKLLRAGCGLKPSPETEALRRSILEAHGGGGTP